MRCYFDLRYFNGILMEILEIKMFMSTFRFKKNRSAGMAILPSQHDEIMSFYSLTVVFIYCSFLYYSYDIRYFKTLEIGCVVIFCIASQIFISLYQLVLDIRVIRLLLCIINVILFIPFPMNELVYLLLIFGLRLIFQL